MLVNLFGTWVNPAQVTHLVNDGVAVRAYLTCGVGLYDGGAYYVVFPKTTADAVAAELNRLEREAAGPPPRPRFPHPQTGDA